MKLIEFLISKECEGWKWPNGIAKAVVLDVGRTVSFFYNDSLPPALSETLIAPCIFVEHECVTREQYEAALAASKPEWDGEGLPPSGVEFEYLRGNFGADEGRWVKCTMKYAGDKFCIVHLEGEGESWLKHEGTKIRPIRSEADKKRDEIAKAINSAVDASGTLGHMIYDAIAAGKIPHTRID
ncbi:hypothetical protein [Enterobacter roggenkampii]|uniref:hypothetical protein n=1 Tax=Enterobacter roggenkampii TaxID=1812935 RepID=UPI001330536F|nr:hypothetical protein [Enterobacter roggenkampii]